MKLHCSLLPFWQLIIRKMWNAFNTLQLNDFTIIPQIEFKIATVSSLRTYVTLLCSFVKCSHTRVKSRPFLLALENVICRCKHVFNTFCQLFLCKEIDINSKDIWDQRWSVANKILTYHNSNDSNMNDKAINWEFLFDLLSANGIQTNFNSLYSNKHCLIHMVTVFKQCYAAMTNETKRNNTIISL